MKRFLLSGILIAILTFNIASAQTKITVQTEESAGVIDRHIFGQFSEHLGRGIYPGIWVGEDSDIPNTEGYRTDVLEALQDLSIPNIRWPGGCYADDYNWRDGIGPRDKRPVTLNVFWGQVPDENSFGTHEFLRFTDLINAEPYLSVNVGSSTPKEMSDWVEYLTYSGETTLTKERRANGKDEPWKIKFWGIGNESWGCGGNMTAEFYADKYKQFATYARDLSGNELYRVASGKYNNEYAWTDTLMRKAGELMDAISLHYYTLPTDDWDDKGPSIGFGEDQYISTLRNGLKMEDFVIGHSKVMDKYDPDKRVVLAVDEWGIWTNQLEGTTGGFLEQQNTLRDAFLASTTLDIFAKHNDRVKLANIAQTVNVLQAMILTEGDKMVKTPTYYVFQMYKVHQDATRLPLELDSPDYSFGDITIPALSATASKAEDGSISITLTNVDPKRSHKLALSLEGLGSAKISSAQILTADKFNSYNTYEKPNTVVPKSFKGASLKGEQLTVDLPAKSLVVLTIK